MYISCDANESLETCIMKTLALLAAALALPFGAAAQPARGYSAVPATAPTIAAMMTRSTPWKCAADRCVTNRTEGSPLTMCQLAAKELGTLTAFTANGEAFAAEQLAKCNTRAKSA
ncbi:hypothetical protein ASE65_10645 [Sphingomonas sp. Leaf16]|nr:hypothetical protein ASE65_10645 [Sphingomonas sp. Leaf16]KQN11069.1 hypothetical protein ASE81_11635 [Sphingomonas sp. Leaf29]KQN18368.1 hypothetical protein ASE83_11560 [Sphingomonas sp. Leaf32]